MTNKLDHQLYKRTNYTNKDLLFLESSKITEYDMESAGMNILRTLGYLNKEDIDYLNSLSKHERVVYIGKELRKNPKMNEDLEFGFEECRRIFMENNDLNKNDILSIKKDAIYVIDKPVNHLKVNEYIRFSGKNTYDTYINLIDKEHYINLETGEMDVKGYPKATIENHKDYMFKFLLDTLYMNRDGSSIALAEHLTLFKHHYVTRNLDRGYYKNLVENKYLINMVFGVLGIDYIDKVDENIDINYNLMFILEVINRLMI